MADKKISELIEILNVDGTEYVPIVSDGMNKKVKVSALKGSDNLTSNYVELIGDDGKTYRAVVKDGQLIAYDKEVDTANPASSGDNALYDGLIINKMYGGGSSLVNTAVSHSFIELYNCKNVPLNLKGLYLWYKTKSSKWQSLELKGIVPPYHSFLIRGAEHNDYHKDFVRCHVDKYDMNWNIKFANNGFSVYLCIGSEMPEDNPVRATYDAISGVVTWTNPRYIDLLGAGGINPSDNVTAYETRFLNCMSENIGVMREDFANSGGVNIGSNKSVKGNNEADCLPIDYSTCDVNIYRPRSLADGEWTVYYDKLQLKQNCPNLINICCGQNGDTTRTFTWQSTVTKDGFLKYRKQGELAWTKVETEKRLVRHKDCDVTCHSVIIKGLTNGIYEYQAGEEGAWSDIETFEIRTFSNSNPLKIMWTSDEQGWTDNEYSAVETAAKFIQANETFDIHLNTGDVSQNANRSFEWRNYFRYYPSNKNVPHMLACGNNDLIDKKYSDAFTYYSTYENQLYNSVYSWDIGCVHFVCLNSNTDYTYIDGDGSIGGFTKTDDFIQAQATWLDTHLTQVKARNNKPKWIIVYSHLSPFTVGRVKRLQRWVSVVEKHKVDVFLCGHNHAYSRSKALYTGYDFTKSPAYNDYATKVSGTSDLLIVDEFKADGKTEINRAEDKANGTVYILAQATGYKLIGKERPITLPNNLKGTKHDNGLGQPWWIASQSLPPQPSYITIDISESKLVFNMYYIQNILEKDVNGNVTVLPYDKDVQTKYLFDTLTINYSERNK